MNAERGQSTLMNGWMGAVCPSPIFVDICATGSSLKECTGREYNSPTVPCACAGDKLAINPPPNTHAKLLLSLTECDFTLEYFTLAALTLTCESGTHQFVRQLKLIHPTLTYHGWTSGPV